MSLPSLPSLSPSAYTLDNINLTSTDGLNTIPQQHEKSPCGLGLCFTQGWPCSQAASSCPAREPNRLSLFFTNSRGRKSHRGFLWLPVDHVRPHQNRL